MRLPLDSDPEPEAQERHVWSVSDLVADVKQCLEASYSGLWVRGEISGPRRSAPGHWYFSLKDDRAVLNAVMFRRDAQRLPFRLEDGLEVTAFGRLNLYEGSGRFQLVANSLEPVGWGAQQLAFEQLKRRLADEGLFEPSRKRALPLLPACIAVVTSATGAAWHDMVQVWQRRQVAARIVLSPTTVQGTGAAERIAEAIRLACEVADAEVLIVGRGGGSREDLWAFNEEPVARAIAEAPIPVVTGIGHEIDVTIADLVADRRAATPTAAAEIVAPSREELMQRLRSAHASSYQSVRLGIEQAQRSLESPTLQQALLRPARMLESYELRLDEVWRLVDRAVHQVVADRRERLQTAREALGRARIEPRVALLGNRLAGLGHALRDGMSQRLHLASQRLAAAVARTEAMSPLAVLARGYSISFDSAGRILHRSTDVRPGDAIRVRLRHGELGCEVRETTPEE